MVNVTHKLCKGAFSCGEQKPLSEFYTCRAGPYGRQSACKTCTKEREIQRRLELKQHIEQRRVANRAGDDTRRRMQEHVQEQRRSARESTASSVVSEPALPPPSPPAISLYIMRYDFDETCLKIGKARNVAERAKQLESCQNFRVLVLNEFPNAGHLETRVHDYLNEFRCTGGSGREWFKLPHTFAVKAIHTIIGLDAVERQAES